MKIRELIADYLKYMKALGRSYYTIKVAKYEIRALADFMEKEKLYNVEDMTGDVLQRVSGGAGLPLDGKGAAAESGNSIKNAEHDPRLYKVFKAKGLSDA